MFFKNINAFRLDAGRFLLDIENQLASKKFTPCVPSQALSSGFYSPLGKFGSNYSHVVQDNKVMICLRTEEKILPSSVVNELFEDKCDEIEAREGTRPIGRLKLALKDDVIAALLPKAFSKHSNVFAYIDIARDMVVVDTASKSKAEDLVFMLIDAVEGIRVKPIRTNLSPTLMMTDWVHQFNQPNFIKIGDECELVEVSDDDVVVTIRTKNQDLSAEEISNHIEFGKVVSKVELDWDNKASFILKDDLTMSRLKFSDELLDLRVDCEDRVAQFNVDFVLMVNEIGNIFTKLIELLEGDRREW